MADRRPAVAASRWITPSRAGAAYVAAWVAGLALSPTGISSTEPAVRVATYLAQHRVPRLGQGLLVHGLAGGALVAFAAGVAAAGTGPAAHRLARAGQAAGAISLVQAALGVVITLTAGHVAASSTRSGLAVVERLDALKLVALAAALTAGSALARRGALPRWTGPVAGAGVVTLLVGAVGLAVGSVGLAAAAVPALVLLLVWVGGVAASLGR